ncbi:carbohydrate ABC transporter permease [Listeria booriae]|uniref:Sugar ABC transporter permease n=1 Tax=Listeria booriae TaxID=1552123 RepID=A0A7X0YNV3_9LIST|nr:sugar ABC transporter permease [Listeria booriae]MBC1210005.1 sugar ABC transporter permease [Listeria booriae]MBC1246399.1 sugar ABC transporter permease [Listeria booriae]MBC1272267.1 sugar ABC transporter permease [Listeria booriae]MBC1284597.1 sugar ABC transporter permease [Listeria booriae]MBC1306389.1 sugar ABC transporter permease [Listeria booriae]
MRKNSGNWMGTLGTVAFLSPYFIMFFTFIVVPVLVAILLSFTYFNSIEFPTFIGLKNYVSLLTQDAVFMQYVLPNTLKFSLIVGPGGYLLSFLTAWLLAQIPHRPRTFLALIMYTPSMTAGVAMTVLWAIIFSGNASGYINSILLRLNLIVEPIQFLQSPDYLMNIMIVVSLWSSMGVGFLAMLSGILNINPEVYEAAYIDGIKNRFQEIIYITIPSMKPQMLFGAVMAVVGTFQAGAIGVALSGTNPTPQYAGQLMVNHIDDYGFIRYEMGYAAAISVLLLVIVYLFSRVAMKLFGEKS